METSAEANAKAKELEDQAKALREVGSQLWLKEQRARPLAERLVYAAHSRCPCGAGLAYDPAGASGGYPDESKGEKQADTPFKGSYGGYWDCSAIILGTADSNVKHEAQLPFAFYEVKSENQPSAGGATTRPKA